MTNTDAGGSAGALKSSKGGSDGEIATCRAGFQFKENFYDPFFTEARRLLSHGNRVTLGVNDLVCPEDLKTENVYREFAADFEKEKREHRDKVAQEAVDDAKEDDPKAVEKAKTAVLMRACFSRDRREIIFCGMLYGTYYGLQFMGPIFLKRILQGLSCRAYSMTPETCTSKDTLFLYCFLICISPLVGGFCYTHHNYR